MAQPEILPATVLLEWTDDLSQRMVAGLHRFFDRRTRTSVHNRPAFWQRDGSSRQAYAASIQPNRARFARLIGLVDERSTVEMRRYSPVGEEPFPGNRGFLVEAVRWTALDGIHGEGLLLTPRGLIAARAVAVPDADQTPEQITGLHTGVEPASQFARTLAENGCQVLVPVLVNRECWLSASPAFGQTNQPHREWIYRQAFELGRHIIGLEVQKIQAGIDWFKAQDPDSPVGAVGYGEGGLLAMAAATVDERIAAVLVSGYFGPWEDLWQQPIYRNVWSLLVEFGMAEIASLIAPRSLIVEYACEPAVDYSPRMDVYGENGAVASPGKLVTPPYEKVKAEFDRIGELVEPGLQMRRFIAGPEELPVPFGSAPALEQFAHELGLPELSQPAGEPPPAPADPGETNLRQERQVREMERLLQAWVVESDQPRKRFFLDQVNHRDLAQFVAEAKPYRQFLWEELFGRLDDPQPNPNPASRRVYDEEKWVGYEVTLEVWEDVFAWGILCLPRDIKPGENRPVVVCQHGYEGLPRDTIEDTPDGLQYYKRFAARLAERGFITFAPHNPYRGAYHYKQLQRKANPLKASLASVIIGQHTQIVRWLGSLPFVDPNRIGFYGLSYGGWTAVRIPPVVEGYCLSICSANFNDWVRKVISVHFNNSYMGDASFEMCEWNAANTFSNAEMAYLMVPRPFMVERGMHDIVAPDSWVAAEYARVRWLYTQLGIPEQTEMEFFNREHEINGQGSFAFLHKHLNWPEPKG